MNSSEIARVNEQLMAAIANKDASAGAALYSPDAIFFAANTTLRGNDAVRDLFGRMAGLGISGLELVTEEIDAIGDKAYECGSYTLRDDTGAEADSGTFMVIWKLIHGEWRFHRDVITGELPV
jgi:ketosteroid isomerase-like protein